MSPVIKVMRSHSNRLDQNSNSVDVSSVHVSSLSGNLDNVEDGERLLRPRALVSEISNNNVEENELVHEG